MSMLNQQFNADQLIRCLNQQLGDMTKALRDEQVRGQDVVRRIRELEAEERRVKVRHLLELEERKTELAKVKREGVASREEVEKSMVLLRGEHEEEMRKFHEQNEGRVTQLIGGTVGFRSACLGVQPYEHCFSQSGFQELERDLWTFREMLEPNSASTDNVQEAFKANADIVPAIVEEMREIVKSFQRGKKRETKQSGW
ncbi:hypothetical protein V8E51_004992 [Hyaloscypha variabilis]